MPEKNKRKLINFSIKRNLQIRLFIKVLGVALVGIGLMAVIFYFYSDREIQNSFRMFHIHAENFVEYLFPAAALSVAAATVFAAVIALFFPLGIAGPLYRIEAFLKERVAEGDLSAACEIRKGDDLGDLAEVLNVSIDKLGRKIRTVKESAKKLDSAVAGLDAPDTDVLDLTQKINKELDNFKV